MREKNEKVIFSHDGGGMDKYSLVASQNEVGSVIISQSFPSFYLGYTVESVVIRLEDIDTVIEYLQNAKNDT